MQEDHIAGLIKAIDDDHDDEAKRHLAGLAYQVMNLLGRVADALENIAAAK